MTCRALAFLAACLVLSAPLTAVAIVVIAPSLVAQLAFYRRIRANERAMIINARVRAKEVRDLVGEIGSGVATNEDTIERVRRYASRQALGDLLTRYRRRLNTAVFAEGLANMTLLVGMLVIAVLLL